MSIKKFDKIPRRKYIGADRIPGTDKVRTFCPAGHLYSERFSSIDFIASNQYRPQKKEK